VQEVEVHGGQEVDAGQIERGWRVEGGGEGGWGREREASPTAILKLSHHQPKALFAFPSLQM
jgi:hypothetical protein